MCGIAGFYSPFEKIPDNAELILRRMGSVIHHRGPDDSGMYLSRNCGLAFQRLAIIDLENGRQPMESSSGMSVIVFNGEIYNFRELRKKLEQSGSKFRTQSDTETILAGYEKWGEKVLDRLRGMFAFALLDKKRNELLLARDHTGIKPLYYSRIGNFIVFGSEIKAILEFPGVVPGINVSMLPKYMSFLWVPAPDTLFRNIFMLEPAKMLRVDKTGVSEKRYWEPELTHPDKSLGLDQWIMDIDSELQRVVNEQMVSDVPLGAFLSGGVDSSTIIALMNRTSGRRITTCTTGFHSRDMSEDVIGNDLEYARIAGKYLNVDYNELILDPDVVKLLPQLVRHMDEPIADPAAITTFLICKKAKQKCTVMLSGVGGDEIFGGYPRYLANRIAEFYQNIPTVMRRKWIPPFIARLPSGKNTLVRNLKKFIKSAEYPFIDRYLGYLTYYSREELHHFLRMDFNWDDVIKSHMKIHNKYTCNSRLQTMMNIDLFTFLPNLNLAYTDRMSSAASVEVRVPFLDHILVEKAASIPEKYKIRKGIRKYILKKMAEKYLPGKIIWRKKAGFGAPVGAWLKGKAKEMMLDLLSEHTIKRRGYFNPEFVHSLVNSHLIGREYYANQLWQLMVFETWHREYLD